MIEYKAVAMDLDDTLLTSDLQISEETKQTLLQCQKDLCEEKKCFLRRNLQYSIKHHPKCEKCFVHGSAVV